MVADWAAKNMSLYSKYCVVDPDSLNPYPDTDPDLAIHVNIRCRIQGFDEQSGSGSTTQLFTFLLVLTDSRIFQRYFSKRMCTRQFYR